MRGVATAGIGIGIGLLAALFLTRLLEGMLYEVEPRDPRTFALVTLLFAGIALVASGVPAVRAAKVVVIALTSAANPRCKSKSPSSDPKTAANAPSSAQGKAMPRRVSPSM